MRNTDTEAHVWFMRHGEPSFNYTDPSYDELIEILSNGYDAPLVKEHGIDFGSLPSRVELVCHSPARRAVETAQELMRHLDVRSVLELESLSELALDREIIHREEYDRSLAKIRPIVLKRWYLNQNNAESFTDSLTRVRKIEAFLNERPEQTIILVTHGWFLRLLEIYFVQGKREGIRLSDLLKVEPVKVGHCFKASVARKDNVKSLIPQM